MCQSKAEGGRRCAYHLEQGVQTGMLSYTATLTGLTATETTEVFESLEREALDAPDPTREEVDAFLEEQAFRVRHDPDLTDKRRASILDRLRAAIGRITPNGATFHAWRNMVAEAWSKARHKAAAAFLVGMLTVSVAGCGSAPTDHSADPPPQPVASLAANQNVTQFDTAFHATSPTISPDAAAKFGDHAVQQATDVITTVTEQYGMNEEAASAPRYGDAAHMLSATEYMTPSAAKDWRATVASYNSHTGNDDGTKMLSFALYEINSHPYSVHGKTITRPTSGPMLTNRHIDSVHAHVARDGRLRIDTKASVHYRLRYGDAPSQVTFHRNTSFWMVHTPGGWKIDGWQSSFTNGPITPEM